MNDIVNKIVKNAFFNFLHRMVGFLSAIILSVIIARMLGPERFGSYALVKATLVAVGILVNLGLAHAGVKYISEFSGEKNKNTRLKILFYLLKIKVSLALVVCFILVTLSKYYANFYSDDQLRIYLIISAIGLVPSGITSIFVSFFQGQQKYSYLAYRSIIISPIYTVFSFIALKMGYEIIGLISVNLMMSFIEVLFYLPLFKKEITFKSFFSLPSLSSDIKKRIFRYNWQLALIVLVDAIIWQRSEVFFLGKFKTTHDVAFYSLAYGIIENALLFLPSIFTGILMPIMSELNGKNDTIALQKLYINSTKYLSLISVPLFVGFMVFSKYFILFLYGKDYLAATPILNILLISGCAGIISAASSDIQYSVEKQDLILKVRSCVAILNIILAFILIPRFGAIGAACANTSSQLIAIIITTILTCKLISVNFPLKDLLKILLASFCMVPIITVITKITAGILSVIFSIFGGIITYSILLIFLKEINNKDIRILKFVNINLPKIIQRPLNGILNTIEGYVK